MKKHRLLVIVCIGFMPIVFWRCKPALQTQQIVVTTSSAISKPIYVRMSSFFELGLFDDVVEKPNTILKYNTIPGASIFINSNFSTISFYNADTVVIDNSADSIQVITSNLTNKRYQSFLNDLANMRITKGIPQTTNSYFADKQDSILANIHFIDNYLSKYDSLNYQNTKQLCETYQFSPAVTENLLAFTVQTTRLNQSLNIFRNYRILQKADSLGLMPAYLEYYLNEVNKQKVTVFSQNTIEQIIRFIASEYIRQSLYRIASRDSLLNYYKDVKQYFPKKSTAFDYLVSRLWVQAANQKISVKGATFKQFRKDAQQSIFKNFATAESSALKAYHLKINAPNQYQLYTPQNQNVNLSTLIEQYKNKPLLIDFWATWCLPCAKARPEIMQYAHQYPNLNLVFISIDESQGLWQSYLKKHSEMSNFAQYRSNKNNQDSLSRQLTGVPTYGLLNKNGKIELIDEVNDSIINQYYNRFYSKQ